MVYYRPRSTGQNPIPQKERSTNHFRRIYEKYL
nr:MAG TPA: hypothetical protein [Caudoviricetes sp.]